MRARAPLSTPSLSRRTSCGRIRAGALATLDRESGFPFASLVTVATDQDGSPLLLLSRLASHTVNLDADPRASLLLAETGKGDPLAHPRLTVIGRAERVEGPNFRSRFLARHPKAALYADFADFSFVRLLMQGGPAQRRLRPRRGDHRGRPGDRSCGSGRPDRGRGRAPSHISTTTTRRRCGSTPPASPAPGTDPGGRRASIRRGSTFRRGTVRPASSFRRG